jgi:hypothetical protein
MAGRKGHVTLGILVQPDGTVAKAVSLINDRRSRLRAGIDRRRSKVALHACDPRWTTDYVQVTVTIDTNEEKPDDAQPPTHRP